MHAQSLKTGTVAALSLAAALALAGCNKAADNAGTTTPGSSSSTSPSTGSTGSSGSSGSMGSGSMGSSSGSAMPPASGASGTGR